MSATEAASLVEEAGLSKIIRRLNLAQTAE